MSHLAASDRSCDLAVSTLSSGKDDGENKQRRKERQSSRLPGLRALMMETTKRVRGAGHGEQHEQGTWWMLGRVLLALVLGYVLVGVWGIRKGASTVHSVLDQLVKHIQHSTARSTTTGNGPASHESFVMVVVRQLLLLKLRFLVAGLSFAAEVGTEVQFVVVRFLDKVQLGTPGHAAASEERTDSAQTEVQATTRFESAVMSENGMVQAVCRNSMPPRVKEIKKEVAPGTTKKILTTDPVVELRRQLYALRAVNSVVKPVRAVPPTLADLVRSSMPSDAYSSSHGSDSTADTEHDSWTTACNLSMKSFSHAAIFRSNTGLARSSKRPAMILKENASAVDFKLAESSVKSKHGVAQAGHHRAWHDPSRTVGRKQKQAPLIFG